MDTETTGVDSTRAALADAFCILSIAHPDHYPTIVSIVRHAGYNRATFYRYFEDIFSVTAYLEEKVISQIAKRLDTYAHTDLSDEALIDMFIELDDSYHLYLSTLFEPLYRAHFIDTLKHALAPIFTHMVPCDQSDPYVAALLDMFFSAILSNVARFLEGSTTLDREGIVALNKGLLTSWLIPQLRSFA